MVCVRENVVPFPRNLHLPDHSLGQFPTSFLRRARDGKNALAKANEVHYPKPDRVWVAGKGRRNKYKGGK